MILVAFGLVEMPRSNLIGGETPRHFFLREIMKELSIFVDESGDFGIYNSKYAPRYIFSMVFHEQENDITDNIRQHDIAMANLGYINHVVHTSPLIRKEEAYCNLMPNERRAIFTKLFFFAKGAPIKYKSFCIERKECPDDLTLSKAIRSALERFIVDYIEYFVSFDRVILYYDNGQKELASIMQEVLSERIPGFYRKLDVTPYKYKLLQVADMLCTLKLLEIKAEHNNLSASEQYVFHGVRDLKKDFLKKIKDKEFP